MWQQHLICCADWTLLLSLISAPVLFGIVCVWATFGSALLNFHYQHHRHRHCHQQFWILVFIFFSPLLLLLPVSLLVNTRYKGTVDALRIYALIAYPCQSDMYIIIRFIIRPTIYTIVMMIFIMLLCFAMPLQTESRLLFQTVYHLYKVSPCMDMNAVCKMRWAYLAVMLFVWM